MIEYPSIFTIFTLDFLFLNISYLIILFALLLKDILWLRLVYIVAEILMILYGIYAIAYYISIWNTLFLLINIIQVIRLIIERKPITLPHELEDIYKKVFSKMTTKEFLFFWNIGKLHTESHTLLCEDGKVQETLSLILTGKVIVKKRHVKITELHRGSFISEMSFLTGEPASADVIAEEEIEYISWSQEKLRHLSLVNSDVLLKVQVILGKDLTNKLKIE